MNTQINVSEKRESKKVTNKPRKRELMVTNVFLMQKKYICEGVSKEFVSFYYMNT